MFGFIAKYHLGKLLYLVFLSLKGSQIHKFYILLFVEILSSIAIFINLIHHKITLTERLEMGVKLILF